MWTGNYIYFASDRDKIMNIFRYNTQTANVEKITNFSEYDVKFPSIGDDAIVFENGGCIYRLDLNTLLVEKITIEIKNDLIRGRNRLVDLSQNIPNTIDIAPNGKKIIATFRGDIFTIPVKEGVTQNLTESSNAHDRNMKFSPNGKQIAYISDKSGEDEIYIVPNDLSQEPLMLTSSGDNYKYNLKWSPDNTKIIWNDRAQRLQYIEINTRKITEIDKAAAGEIHDFNFSPDGKWIVYTLPRANTTSVIMLYNIADKTKYTASDEWFNSNNPIFSNNGKYLFFLSQRNFNPTYSATEWNHAYNNMTGLYFVTLGKDDKSPFSLQNEDNEIDNGNSQDRNEIDKQKKNKNENNQNTATDVKIDLDNIKERSLNINNTPGHYSNIFPINEKVYYNRNGKCYMFDLLNNKEIEIGNFAIISPTADMKKMLVREKNKFSVINTPITKTDITDFISMANVKTTVNPKQEWTQIFNEAWRQMRDFFYDPNMHGINWPEIRKKYAPLVEHVYDRNDLNYIIGEMIAELSAGHTYIGGGDRHIPEKIATGLLGAQISRDKSGYYLINKILKGQNWSEELRSPLTEVGMNVSEGDFIIAINGKSTSKIDNIYKALAGTAERPIELTVNTKPQTTNSRKIIVKPIADESQLYYLDWVNNNMQKVDKATNGKVGYVHVPDMLADGLNEFVKHYYPQLNRQALIIDDRGNGGGNVSPMIIERLRREISAMTLQRNGTATPKPSGTFVGPKIMLIDQYSASDGDLFPYQFKYYKLGKTVGTRTWGGVVGIRGSLPFIDGTTLNCPEFAPYDPEGKNWIIEGYGVDPDIVIENDPAKEYRGQDQQLDKAIEIILEELKTNPGNYPNPPDKFPEKINQPKRP
jgi:tricorn protease